jgi:predicted nucleic acid-binding protein
MRPIALDTNTYAGFKRGDPDCVEVFQRAEHLLVSTVVLAELLSGFAFGTQEARNREELRLFLDCSRVAIKEAGLATADAYALIYSALRRGGRPIPTNDLWIAAACVEHGAVLFSFDAHFDHVAGLRRITRWAEALP